MVPQFVAQVRDLANALLNHLPLRVEAQPGGVVGADQQVAAGQGPQIGEAVAGAGPEAPLPLAALLPDHHRELALALEAAAGIEALAIRGPGDLAQVAIVKALAAGGLQRLQVLAGEQRHRRRIGQAHGDAAAIGGEGDGKGLLAARGRAFGDEVEVGIVEPDLTVQGGGHQVAVGAEVAPEAGVVILAIAGDRLPARRGPDAQAARAMAGGQVTTVPGKAQVVDHIGQTHQVVAQLAAGPIEKVDEITALPLAPGLGRPAGGHPLTIRGQGGGVEAALVPGADGGPQGAQ